MKISALPAKLMPFNAPPGINNPTIYPSPSAPSEAKNEVLKKLKADFGTWEVPWGDVNRFQRIDNSMTSRFDDNQPSVASPFASSSWGTLPSFNSRAFQGSKKRYGYGGNSFICAVEFGKKLKAKSLLAGGESGNPTSKHFKDQLEMYTKGQFKDVLFYKEDIMKNMEEQYMPGMRK
jgi:acyl-homoserine lactone acylase PvdQ